MPLIYGLKDGVDLQDLVLQPHLDVYERVCEGVWQVVEVLLQVLILGILEKELLLGQLVLFR